MMFYVYVLKDEKTKKLYYGYSSNLERRLSEHKRKNRDWELVYYEAYKKQQDARSREIQLKRYAQALTALKRRLKESLK